MCPKDDIRVVVRTKMKFYIGTHMVNHAKYFERSFISVNVLRRRRSDFTVNDWILDSGAFTEISTHGHYRFPVEDYARSINRWKLCGQLEYAVCQDYMCEPFILSKTGLSVLDHQRLTIERYDHLVPLTDVAIMPVLQGYTLTEYLRHLEMYGSRLVLGAYVGVGSICKRNSKPTEIAVILEGIKRERPDVRLHGFGLKTTALVNAYICSLLYSADSMAWSYHARRNGGNPNGLEEAQSFLSNIVNRQGTKAHQFMFT